MGSTSRISRHLNKSFRGEMFEQGTHGMFHRVLILPVFMALHSISSKGSVEMGKKDIGEENSWLVPGNGRVYSGLRRTDYFHKFPRHLFRDTKSLL